MVEIEKKTAHVFIIDLATSVGLLLGDHLMGRRQTTKIIQCHVYYLGHREPPYASK
jgi:hypothetical protein